MRTIGVVKYVSYVLMFAFIIDCFMVSYKVENAEAET
jgi:hypothetical protein